MYKLVSEFKLSIGFRRPTKDIRCIFFVILNRTPLCSQTFNESHMQKDIQSQNKFMDRIMACDYSTSCTVAIGAVKWIR